MSFIIRYAYMICLRTFTPLKIVDPSYIATITLANVHRFSHFFHVIFRNQMQKKPEFMIPPPSNLLPH